MMSTLFVTYVLSSSMTLSNVKYVQQSVNDLFSDITDHIMNSAAELFTKLGIDKSSKEVSDFRVNYKLLEIHSGILNQTTN